MCGRLSLAASTDAILGLFGLEGVTAVPTMEQPRYNIAPTDPLLALRLDKQGQRQLRALRWGLVPHWSKEVKGRPLINARSETVASKPAFRDSFERRRCLIPSDGFYEWEKRGPEGKDRQPWRFCRVDDGPMAFAGVWARWRGPDGEVVDSASILTVPANGLVSPLHDRMPAILATEDFETWLHGSAEQAQPLLLPAPETVLRTYPVSKRVNKVRSDGPALWDEIDPEMDGPALPLFDD